MSDVSCLRPHMRPSRASTGEAGIVGLAVGITNRVPICPGTVAAFTRLSRLEDKDGALPITDMTLAIRPHSIISGTFTPAARLRSGGAIRIAHWIAPCLFHDLHTKTDSQNTRNPDTATASMRRARQTSTDGLRFIVA